MEKTFREWSIEQRWLLAPSAIGEDARGSRHFSMRGVTKVRGERSLVCTVQNVLKLAARRP